VPVHNQKYWLRLGSGRNSRRRDSDRGRGRNRDRGRVVGCGGYDLLKNKSIRMNGADGGIFAFQVGVNIGIGDKVCRLLFLLGGNGGFGLISVFVVVKIDVSTVFNPKTFGFFRANVPFRRRNVL
jgi:hypothetical protein